MPLCNDAIHLTIKVIIIIIKTTKFLGIYKTVLQSTL